MRTLENIQVLKIIFKVQDFYEEENIMTFLSPTNAIPPLCGPWLSLCFVKSPCEIILPIHTVFYSHIIEGGLWDYPIHHLCFLMKILRPREIIWVCPVVMLFRNRNLIPNLIMWSSTKKGFSNLTCCLHALNKFITPFYNLSSKTIISLKKIQMEENF